MGTVCADFSPCFRSPGGTANYGTDIEFARVGARQYAFAGSYKMQIVDITDPQQSKTVAAYDCGVTQGDVQIFRQKSKPGRLFAGYASDTFGDGTSTCKGTHNHTIHPSGDYLYNSNSDLITSVQPAIEIFDISNFAAPVKVKELALPTRPGLGTESHDISFNKAGDRAYSAALSQGVIINTTNPARPTIVTSFLDPAINVWHQAEPFTMGGREFLIVEDEFAGAVGTGQCPNGGVHAYEITGDKELNPVKLGYWNIDDVGPTNSATESCTAHVFQIHEQQKLMTIAFYNGGVRVVDISGLLGISLGDSTMAGGPGMREIASYRTQNGDGAGNADSWSAKTPQIAANGDFHLYGNDIVRGLDVYKFTASAPRSTSAGTWLTPAQAQALRARQPKVGLTRDTAFFCLLPQS